MNIFILLLFLNIIHIVLSKFTFKNYNHDLNRLSLRYVVFKEKKLAKILRQLKHKFDIYHNKSIVSVAEGIIAFQELSEDEKTLIEVVISLCY